MYVSSRALAECSKSRLALLNAYADSPSSLDFALPSVPDSNRRLSYGSPASPQTGYPPGPLSGASPQRPRWSVTSGSEAPSDLRATRTRETFDLTADTELDDPNTFRER